MNLFNFSLGNLENGDIVKLFKENNSLSSGVLLKMKDDKALAVKLNEDQTSASITTINTVISGEEMFANMDRTQLQELIKVLMEIATNMK